MKTFFKHQCADTCALAAFAICSASAAHAESPAEDPTRIGHLIVERLDVVEPDGTLRLVLYSKARDPQIIVRGNVFPHPSRTQSGMLFYNDEGTEVGGLVFAGSRDADGTSSSGGSLTFDGYEQDQIVQILGYREDGEGLSGLAVTDRPEEPMDFGRMQDLANATNQEEAEQIAEDANFEGTSRAFFGRDSEENSTVVLRDGEGRRRLVMRVGADGEAEIVFFDEQGNAIRTIGPDGEDRG